jgi:hypothetical protein
LSQPVAALADIQQRLVAYYGLDAIPAVEGFVSARDDVERERLLVRDADDAVELTLELPAHAVEPGPVTLDVLCQLVEGVSHFVLVAERARRELPTTQLELELQAEVDKFVVLAIASEQEMDAAERVAVHRRLFGAVHFFDPAGTECGDRYRMAHSLAMRFTYRLEHRFLRAGRRRELREALRHFHRVGQAAKLSLALAA